MLCLESSDSSSDSSNLETEGFSKIEPASSPTFPNAASSPTFPNSFPRYVVARIALQLTLNATLGVGIEAEVVISESNGITLPIRMARSEDESVSNSAPHNAAEGGSSPMPALLAEPVEAFLVWSLDFNGAAETMPAWLVVSFTLSCALNVGDEITLKSDNEN